MQEIPETRVRSLGQEDPLEEGMATQSSILAWRIPWTESLVGYSPQGCKESDTTEVTKHARYRHILKFKCILNLGDARVVQGLHFRL